MYYKLVASASFQLINLVLIGCFFLFTFSLKKPVSGHERPYLSRLAVNNKVDAVMLLVTEFSFDQIMMTAST